MLYTNGIVVVEATQAAEDQQVEISTGITEVKAGDWILEVKTVRGKEPEKCMKAICPNEKFSKLYKKL